MDLKRTKLLVWKAQKKLSKALAVVSRTEAKPLSTLVSSTPTRNLILMHYSNGDEKDYQCIQSYLAQLGTVQSFVLASGVSYGLVMYEDQSAAEQAYQKLNDPEEMLPFSPRPHFVSAVFTSMTLSQFSFATEECLDAVSIQGLSVFTDFINADEESFLISNLDQRDWVTLTNRRVQHYGYEFLYGANAVNPDMRLGPLPDWVQPVLEKFRTICDLEFDQLTVNEYLPGDSIPPHTDSHSPFEEPLLSLSLLHPIGMNWTNGSTESNLWLPARSLLLMTDEARYIWKHSIQQKRFDVHQGNAVFRARRISLTFRKIRKTPCVCRFPEQCDRTMKTEVPITGDIQKKYVQETYDKIAPHFSHTRYKPWPQVHEFLRLMEPGSLVLDVGCGNGKYLQSNEDCELIGTDRSGGLLSIAGERGFPVFLADGLHLPVRSRSVDAVISIAVIHHFSTKEMRQQAVLEILRVLKVESTTLIYVWAKEQSERTFDAQDCLVPWHLQQCFEDGVPSGVVEEEKSAVRYDRFYHVFVQGELEALVTSAHIDGCSFSVERSYYDHSNWCVVCRKRLTNT